MEMKDCFNSKDIFPGSIKASYTLAEKGKDAKIRVRVESEDERIFAMASFTSACTGHPFSFD